jgi:hypothetical protein
VFSLSRGSSLLLFAQAAQEVSQKREGTNHFLFLFFYIIKNFVRVLNAVFSFPRLASIDCKLVVDNAMNRMNHLRLFVCPEINV